MCMCAPTKAVAAYVTASKDLHKNAEEGVAVRLCVLCLL